MLPDSGFTAIDQRIIMTSAQIKAAEELLKNISAEKVDSIKYDENENSLQLLSGENGVGSKVILKTGEIGKDGIPVVIIDGEKIPDTDIQDDDVVEF